MEVVVDERESVYRYRDVFLFRWWKAEAIDTKDEALELIGAEKQGQIDREEIRRKERNIIR